MKNSYEIDSRELDNEPEADDMTAEESELYGQFIEWFFQNNEPGFPTAEKFAEWLKD